MDCVEQWKKNFRFSFWTEIYQSIHSIPKDWGDEDKKESCELNDAMQTRRETMTSFINKQHVNTHAIIYKRIWIIYLWFLFIWLMFPAVGWSNNEKSLSGVQLHDAMMAMLINTTTTITF